ncbi:ATP-binding protein [Mesoterricola sediminis]|uniref:ATP-binding protein n=1 Tax=Mesoterricola sediminis TaxID=2927980 RepID=UPI001FAF8634|nr:ATP-binding protein [Mesoterricola sediminis]
MNAAKADPTGGPILVGLGSDARSLRLVHAGFRMASERGCPWRVVHVEVPGWNTPEESDQARVWLQEASELGAEALWVRAPSVVSGLLAQARGRTPSLIILGLARARGPWDRLERSRIHALLGRHLDVPLLAVPLDGDAPREPRGDVFRDLVGVGAALAVILVLAGIFGAALAVEIGFPALALVFGLAIWFIHQRWGLATALAGVAGSLALYAGVFPGPARGLAVGDWPHLAAFAANQGGVLLLVHLLERLRREYRAGRIAQAESVLLMLLGRSLARCSTIEEVAEVLTQRIQGLFHAEAWMRLPAEGGGWRSYPEGRPAPPCPAPEQMLPAFAAAPAGEDPLAPLHLAPCAYVPLGGPAGPAGLLQLRPAGGGSLPQHRWGLLQAFATQGSLALERIRWVEAAQRARVENETERARSALLGAVSHDLRTPLAAIQGAATSLLLPEGALPEASRRDLLAMIRDESVRLARLLGNLLDLTRLESGVLRVQKAWQPLDEVVGSALGRAEREGPLPVDVVLPADLPPVPLDGGLMEQVLLNLLANARRHAGGSPVRLEAWAAGDSVELAVEDRGPGIPEAYHARVFEKFFRMPDRQGDGGVGLGLAICDAILKAHEGRIWVEDRAGGGARFRLSLPTGGPPPEPPLETGP